MFASLLVPVASADTVQVATNTSAWHAIASASFVVQLVLLSLVVMSVVSWAIMVQKQRQFKAVEEANIPFEEKFWKAGSLEDVNDNLKDYPDSNMAALFRSGYVELKKIAESNLLSSSNSESDAPILTGLDNLQRALRKASDIEISRLEARLIFLATVGSVGPFVGLFGTVWGIMGSFQHIGQTGSASLAVVAPGIAEALIATGIGLAAAIPATIGYNMFVTRIKKQELALNNFSSDFLNLAKRNFFRN
ncbi:MAG: protein TolQ [Bdellovibrionales bacterium]|nr:protein TolQ [Bdellovibrionales bacterium]